MYSLSHRFLDPVTAQNKPVLGVNLVLSTEGSSVFLDHIFEDARMYIENESGGCRRKNFRVKIGE